MHNNPYRMHGRISGAIVFEIPWLSRFGWLRGTEALRVGCGAEVNYREVLQDYE